MKKFLSRLRVGLGGQLALIAAIFFLSFITFNILFQATSGDGYFNEIIAALIGTILAAVVTTMLLRSQSQGEELKERNVEVFRKKVDAYQEFVDQSLELLDDNELSTDEARQLRRSVYKLSLFSSEETVSVVSRFLRAQFVKDDECDLSQVISAFRKELALEHVDELASIDLDVVDSLLRGGDRDQLESVQVELNAFADAIFDRLTGLDPVFFEGAALDPARGIGHGVLATLTCPSGAEVSLSMDYDQEADADRRVDAGLDLSALSQAAQSSLRKLAFSMGFDEENSNEEERLSQTSLPEALIDISAQSEAITQIDGRRVWSIDQFCQAILEIERAAQVTPKRRRGRKAS